MVIKKFKMCQVCEERCFDDWGNLLRLKKPFSPRTGVYLGIDVQGFLRFVTPKTAYCKVCGKQWEHFGEDQEI